MPDASVKPRASIRRFDVFAEYNRLKGLSQRLDQAHAKGYGLWVAKVVASGAERTGHWNRATSLPHGQKSRTRSEKSRRGMSWDVSPKLIRFSTARS